MVGHDPALAYCRTGAYAGGWSAAVAWMILVTVVASKGINKIAALLRWAVLQ